MKNQNSRPRVVASAMAGAVRRFLDTENSGAKLLGIATLIALVWANSALSSAYTELWSAPLPDWLALGGRIPDLKHLINDGAMTLFFLVVGLEIKRELVGGEMNTMRTAALPVIAAAGGMIVPAAIYLAITAGTPAESGWGIPIATDIAFAVAILTAFGSRIPSSLKIFLLSLAIADDVGAIVAIAIFYADQIEVVWLAALGLGTVAVALVTRATVIRWWVALPIGVGLWVAAVFAGIHPTIAGVLLAFSLSVTDNEGPGLEERLHPWTGLVVIPLFGLANTGIPLSLSGIGDALTSRAGVAIVAGLVVGKISGVWLFSWLAVKTGLAKLPEGVGWGLLAGAGAAAGIGFTVSLFITELAFDQPAQIEEAKLAILVASLISAAIGCLILATRPPVTTPD